MNRVPPNNPDAEASVLGAVILRNDALDQLELRADEFYDPRHAEIFAAMRSLQAARKPIDPVTLEQELARVGKLAAIGGLGFVADLMSTVPTADNVQHYAEIVTDLALKRAVMVHASELAARAFRDDISGEEILGELAVAASRINAPMRDTSSTMRSAVRQGLDRLGNALTAKNRGENVSLSLPTGIQSLDVLLRGGLPLRNMHILAGRPGQGKSALARGIAARVNAAGAGVHYFSCEDTTDALVMRQFADLADVDLARMWDLEVNRLEMHAINTVASDLWEDECSGRWIIDDSRGLSIADIALRVRRKLRENGTRLVVIDYAQILNGVKGAKYEKDQQRLAAITKGAADLARAENIAVLLLSQLNRDSVKREDKRPSLEDLRGAGELEQDADVVLMVHRPEYYLRRQDQDDERVRRQLELWSGLGEVLLEKAKNAPAPNKTALTWDAKSATYRDRGVRRPREAA